MRSILHVDLDAFFAAVEQRDKPSLRGKPVIVGGLGPRGVVATASYEARRFGVGSAMSMAQARNRCRNAAFLYPRIAAYRAVSATVFGLLAEVSPVIEPLSLDEAFIDVFEGDGDAAHTAASLKASIAAATGLTASVGVAASKLVAKIASDLQKPDGLVVVVPGTERELIGPMPVTRLWSVGPATAERLRRLGVHTVAELALVPEDELVGLLGNAHGRLLARLARAEDDRPVSAEREARSVSVEDTFDRDVVDRGHLQSELQRMTAQVSARLRHAGLAGRTVTVKVRRHDFTTVSRSATLAGPTDDLRVMAPVARRLLSEIETSDGIRLLGVGMSGLADWSQQDLFAQDEDAQVAGSDDAPASPPAPHRFLAGQDVVHEQHGRGWVWGSGHGLVTVRFETHDSGPGPVKTVPADDPDLSPADPLPYPPAAG